ncbi:unnamed protein product [Blumeria hordei]|uniref:Uncharacterized protein n=1 Tax=Blumeria hordei TaxID=2867405 RepID=A0A383UUR7_BLUHO|nr:unnamed protein product [Blumeria hordei]
MYGYPTDILSREVRFLSRYSLAYSDVGTNFMAEVKILDSWDRNFSVAQYESKSTKEISLRMVEHIKVLVRNAKVGVALRELIANSF